MRYNEIFLSRLNAYSTTYKVSKYGVFPGPYFPVFGLNTKIYGVNNTGKYGPEKLRIRTLFTH